MRRSHLLLAGFGLLMLAGAAYALKAKDVEGTLINENLQAYFDFEGARWLVLDDPNTKGADAKPYFYNTKTEDSQWEDPRKQTGKSKSKASSPSGSTTAPPLKGNGATAAAAVALVPVLLFIGAMVGRIYYLHTYYPELLWPTKERRERQRTNQKFKPQKARGKMSQDGKGGRSANS